MFEAFEGFGCFGETLVNTHWIAFWGVFYNLETNKTFVNTHWMAFWGVLYRLETNKTQVNGECDAVGVCFIVLKPTKPSSMAIGWPPGLIFVHLDSPKPT